VKDPSKAVKALVWERAEGCCERCGRVLRLESDISYHHRRLKGMGGDSRHDTHLAGNLILLCGSGTTGCHTWVHGHPLESRDEGFIVSRWADPTQWGFLSALRGWILIDNEGGWDRWHARP